jgi:predicted transcriptional regulator
MRMQKTPFFRKDRAAGFIPPAVGTPFCPSVLVGKSIPRFLCWNNHLSESAKDVYRILILRMNASGIAFPSIAHVAHEIGRGTTAVEDAIAKLVQSGWIRRERGARKADGTRESNRYQFLWSRHWQLAWTYQQLLGQSKGRTDAAVHVYQLLVEHRKPGSWKAREEALTWARHKGRKSGLTDAEIRDPVEPVTGDRPHPETVEDSHIASQPALAEIVSKWKLFPFCMPPARTDMDATAKVLKKYPPGLVTDIVDYYVHKVWTDGRKVLGEAVSTAVVESYWTNWYAISVVDLRLSGDELHHPERHPSWWSHLKKRKLKSSQQRHAA